MPSRGLSPADGPGPGPPAASPQGPAEASPWGLLPGVPPQQEPGLPSLSPLPLPGEAAALCDYVISAFSLMISFTLEMFHVRAKYRHSSCS